MSAMKAAPRKTDLAALEEKLASVGFQALFQRLTPDVLDAVWRDGAARAALTKLALDPARTALVRFLAAEVLFAKAPGYPPAAARPALAPVYAQALARGFAGSANPWGLPGDEGAATARHVVALGGAALPALLDLLDDNTSMSYHGSREATAGNRYRYRVKDVAAALIAAIRGDAWPVDLDPAARDRAIEALRERIGQEAKR